MRFVVTLIHAHTLFVLSLCAGIAYASGAVQLSPVDVQGIPATELNKPGYHYISRTELEGRFSTLSDFLQQLNGLQIQQLSGLGNPALVSVRGADARHTRVLINGIETADAQYGGYNLNELPINQIESIEIIQDSHSSQLTDRAIGGTIRITTRQTSESQLSVQAGSYGTYTIGLAQPLGNTWQMQLEHQESRNDYEYPVPSPAQDSQNRYKQEALNNAQFRRQSLQLTGGSTTLSTRLRLAQQQKNTENFSRNFPDNTAYLADQTAALEFSGEQHWLSMQQHWQMGYQKRDQQFSDPQGYVGLGMDDNRYQYQKTYAAVDNRKHWSQWQHSTDLQFSEESYTSSHRLDDDSRDCLTPQGACDAYSYQRAGIFGTGMQWENEHRSQSFKASVHHQQVSELSRPRYARINNAASHRDGFTGAALGYQWWLENTEWSLNWKRVARLPTLYERYGNHGLFVGNNDLETEQSQTMTLDVLMSVTPHWQASAALFYRDLKNAIVPVYDSRGIGRYENTSEAKLLGAEWTLAYRNTAWFTQLSGSHYNSTTTSTVKSFQNKQLAGIYHTSLKWQAGFQNHLHSVHTSAEISDDLYLDRSNLIAGDQRWLWSAGYRYQWRYADAGLRLNNITDNQFLDYTNRPSIGREWLVFFNLRF